jgi:hypothetical protein
VVELSGQCPGARITGWGWDNTNEARLGKECGALIDDQSERDPSRDHDHWRGTVLDNTREVFPASLWERPLDINGTLLWFLIRSLPCTRQSYVTTSR